MPDRFPERVFSDQRQIVSEVGNEIVGHQFACRRGSFAPNHRHAGCRDRLRLAVDIGRLVLACLAGAQHHAARYISDLLGQQKVGQKVSDRDQATAIIAEIEDDLGDTRRPELGEAVAQLLCGIRHDERAQIDVADLLVAIVQNADAIAVGNRIQRIIRLGDGGGDLSPLGGAEGNRTRDAGLGGAKRI